MSLLVACDLTTKNIAEKELKGKSPQTILDGKITLLYAENSGGMLSFGDELSDTIKFVIFRIGIGVLLLVLTFYLIYKNDLRRLEYYAFILFLSGGLGNLINRIFNDGYVVDFIILKLAGLSTGIFNLADMYVMFGAGVIIFSKLFTPGNPKNISLQNHNP